MENLGFLAAIGAALVWGSYMTPFKKSSSSNHVQFQAVMTVGIFIFALIVLPIIHYSFSINIYGLIAGIIWASANAMSLTAISDLGLSRALPIWVSAVIITSFFLGRYFIS